VIAAALGAVKLLVVASKEVASPFGTLGGAEKSMLPVIGIQLNFPGAPVLSVNDCTV
jgi:hypothetical protein